MDQRKIRTLPLCCMMIGAVLGSGIVILPPLALDTAGQWAIAGWGLTAAFGVAFAYVFARVGTLFPGEGGAASAVKRAFGPVAKRLAAYFLSGAVLFGPAAVILTVVEYLPPAITPATDAGRATLAAAMQAGCALLLASGLRNMSRFTLVLASSATLLLLTGSGLVLAFHSVPPEPLPPMDAPAMGYTLLLLFWAVVGWEVVGNYGDEVAEPSRTIPRAAVIAGLVVGLVSLAVAAALQYGEFPPEAGHGVAALLHPLFGQASPWVMAGMTAALCVTTYLTVVGAVSRLTAHMAQEGWLPAFLDRRNRHGVPWTAVALYTASHLVQFALVGFGVLDLAGLVAIADGFFLSNALLGTLAAARLFTAPLPRATAGLLALCVLIVLLQSPWQVLTTEGVMILAVIRPGARRVRRAEDPLRP
ncbi:amino acid permease [Pseudodesulfovibrio cashew]|uniref:Amino acid permease n=1 Tax=Pseudodesulfovibrio cashew TaxID=2678688 RepID=A0A6I6JH91_9BACT|nr:APC family permease [Pseudodesulfovibrio cashew]QGY39447.1 amino acid permease [Pseudodesulfovibrio cashew]